MGKTVTKKKNVGFENMSGGISLGLRNDFVAHYVFLKSKTALKGLICSMMSLKPSEVVSVQVLNTVNYGEYVDKVIILDIKVELNGSEFIDIEIQVYLDEFWEKRSLLYLCRTYNEGIGSGEDYSKLKPTTLITITDRNLGLDAEEEFPEFYAQYCLLNIKNHQKYSDLLSVKTLYLNKTDIADDDDIRAGRVFWAKMFLATTWEEIKALSKNGRAFMEAAKELYNANMISEERTVMEAHQRYLAIQNGQKAYYEREIAEMKEEMDKTIVAKDKTIADLKNVVDDRDAVIEDQKVEIERLKAMLMKENT